jgi:hypothetical protein
MRKRRLQIPAKLCSPNPLCDNVRKCSEIETQNPAVYGMQGLANSQPVVCCRHEYSIPLSFQTLNEPDYKPMSNLDAPFDTQSDALI